MPMLPPARTLFVANTVPSSPSWPFGAGPRDFTTITDALNYVPQMDPPPGKANPVAVIIFPGTYSGDIALQSWVFLSSGSTDQNAVTIDGRVTWTPTGAGPELEAVHLYFLTTTKPFAVDTRGKTGGQTTLILNGCFVDGLTVNGRSNSGDNRDFVFAATCVPGPTPANKFTLDKCLFEWVAGRLKGMTFNDCRFRIIGSTAVPPKDPAVNPPVVDDWSVTGTSKGICTGSNFTTDPFIDPNDPNAPKQPAWILSSGTSVEFAGCSLHSLTVAAGATADMRSSECLKLTGEGGVNRRSLTMSVFARQGNNLVTFPVPFADNAYNVSLQLKEPPQRPPPLPPPRDPHFAYSGDLAYPAVTVGGKTPGGFTIYDRVGRNTYDVTVIHD